MTTTQPDPFDTVVIGAGLGGLLAAISAARHAPGSRIVVLEPHQPGGRARCDVRDGFTFNRGPRALYVGGIAERALLEAGARTTAGAAPLLEDPVAIHGGTLHRFPGGPIDSARTTLLTVREKVAVSRAIAALWRTDDARTAGSTVATWLDDRRLAGTARQFIEALVRVSTYANAPESFAAGPALANARLGVSPGVRYLDGGWQSLVDQLVSIAAELGIEVRTTTARSIRRGSDGAVLVAVHDAAGPSELRASTVVIAAGGPDAAAALLGGRPASWGELAPPVTAACLEIGVSQPPQHRFALGIDEPLYASTHCPPARLAPDGMAVVHLMRYQPMGDGMSPDEQRSQLRSLAVCIGITAEHIVTERFLARMVVANTLPTVAANGSNGRPSVEIAEHPGVLLAGDWVGPHGLLLDAVASSASEAGRCAAARSASMVSA